MSEITKKEKLEIEKLQVEIQKLKRPFWKNSSFLIPIFIPFIAILITYFANKDYINLQLEVKKLRLEKESIELEEKKKVLDNKILEQSKVLKNYSVKNDSLNSVISNSKNAYTSLLNKSDKLSLMATDLTKKIQKEQAKANELMASNNSLNKISEHRLHFIAMKDELDRLNNWYLYATNTFFAYIKALEGRWDWYDGCQKNKQWLDTVLLRSNNAYDFHDTLATVGVRLVNTWKSTRPLLSEIDSLVSKSKDFDVSLYITRLKDVEAIYRKERIPWGSWIDYSSLKLKSPAK